jgi:hypothetical protein
MDMRNKGRRAGLLYLLYFALAITAEGVLHSGRTFIGTSIEIVSYLLYALLSLILGQLFFERDRRVAVAAVVVSWIGCAIGILRIGHVSTGFLEPLMFFGIFCLMLGYLILESRLLPKSLGGLLVLAGVGWLVLSLGHPRAMAPYIQGLGIVAEFALMVWLLVFGIRNVDAPAG